MTVKYQLRAKLLFMATSTTELTYATIFCTLTTNNILLNASLRSAQILELNKNVTSGFASPTRRASTLGSLQIAARDEISVALNMVTKLGLLCHDSSSESGPMHRCAAVLLQRSVDFGYKGDGDFWKKVSEQSERALMKTSNTRDESREMAADI